MKLPILTIWIHETAEVFNALGDTVAVVTVPESAIETLSANEVFSVRPFSTTT